MASWMVHLQIAEQVYQKLSGLALDKTAFYLGNIAIDSGKVNKDLSIVPPASVSHWTPTGDRDKCEYEKFFRTYCIDRMDWFGFSFYLGCVAHLLTDNCWTEDIVSAVKVTCAVQLAADKYFILEVKKDWYDQDFLYLRKHPDFEPLSVMQNIHNFNNIYLPWFDADAVQLKIDELVEFYADVPDNLEREYPYLDEAGAAKFVTRTAGKILGEFERLLGK